MAEDRRQPDPPPPILPATPPEAWEPLMRLMRLASRPLERFMHVEASSGVVLLIAAAVAMIWANSPWSDSYTRLWETPIGLTVGGLSFERSLAWFVNDGLMAIFFFVVGMEIRREMHHGELSELRRAALPLAAAVGGMIAPALIFLALVGDAPAARAGWGVPMATDIAFAVGVLALLGKRVPAAVRVLLLAVAVIDDLGAILVIALFYSSGVSAVGFAVAGGGLLGIFALQRLGVRTPLVYSAPALLVWGGTYAAGVHPTIAGVIVGLMTPVRAWFGPEGFVLGVEDVLARLTRPGAATPEELSRSLRQVQLVRQGAISPSERLIEALHPWVAFGVMPIFALANAGVSLKGVSLDGPNLGLALAIGAGLVVGKPLGVLLASGLVLRLGVATLPRGLGLKELGVLGAVAGIGFTMALFIAQLAFKDPGLLGAAKIGVLGASVVAGAVGLGLGALLLPRDAAGTGVASVDEAESLTEA